MTLVISRVFFFALIVATLVASDSALGTGIAAFKEGRYSVALKNLQQAAQDPRDKTAQAFLALTQAALGECTKALPGLIANTDSGGLPLQSLMGVAAANCYSRVGDNTKAFVLLQHLEQRFPDDADILYTSAKLHMKAFNDATFAMFKRVPASYRVHELSGEIFEIENRFPDAAAEYRQAIKLNPNAPDLHFRLGRAILLGSHTSEAFQEASLEFRSELKLNPEDSASEFQLGQIAQVQGKIAEAKPHFERAVALSPTFVQALVALGKIYSTNKEYGQAISLLTRAARAQPSSDSVHYALLIVYRDSGQMEKATAEKKILDRLNKPPEGEFSDFLKRLGEKQPEQ